MQNVLADVQPKWKIATWLPAELHSLTLSARFCSHRVKIWTSSPDSSEVFQNLYLLSAAEFGLLLCRLELRCHSTNWSIISSSCHI